MRSHSAYTSLRVWMGSPAVGEEGQQGKLLRSRRLPTDTQGGQRYPTPAQSLARNLCAVTAKVQRRARCTPRGKAVRELIADSQAALITRQLQPAYPTLTPPYLSVDEVNFGPSDQEADEQGTSYLDVLTYHHHAGLVAAANGDFALATQMFTFVSSQG